MGKLKSVWEKPLGKVVIMMCVGVVLLIIIVKAITPSSSVSKLASTMLNTKNDLVSGDVKLTTQETLSTVEGQTTRLTNELSNVEQGQETWKETQHTDNEKFKLDMNKALKTQQAVILKEIATLKKVKAEKGVGKAVKREHKDDDGFVIGNDSTNQPDVVRHDSSVTWIKDPSNTIKANSVSGNKNTKNNSLLHPNVGTQAKPKPIPYYTIPANTALVNVRPLQPLIGVIPSDGTVVDPETVLFAVGKKGLLANDWSLPPAIKGVQGSSTCTGVFNFNHSSVKCSITSLTFIFNDGRIDTVNGNAQKPLGKLTDHFGNNYIAGHYYGNAAYAAAGTGFFAGVEGWGGALAQGQVQNSTNGTFSSTTIKNATTYAGGVALQNAGQSFNTWWLQLLKTTTNYVLVPNWDKDTHKMLLLNAVITTPVPINYDRTARKVMYSYEKNDSNNSFD